MPKVFTSDSQKTGEIGENVAVKFLMKHGFAILDRNYTKKWGEIDIIAEKENKLHFVEVKSVVREVLENISPENLDEYRPEDNMHPWKLQRLGRTIQSYLMEKKFEGDWQLDLITVKIDQQSRKAKVEMIENIVI